MALPVLYGEVSGADEDGVVMVVASLSNVSHACTGSLLAPNLLITARHCVANFTDEPFTCGPDGELVSTGGGGRMGPLLDQTAGEVGGAGYANLCRGSLDHLPQ